MINMSAQNQRYYCRTKDLLWFRETKIAVEKVLHGDMTAADIRAESADAELSGGAGGDQHCRIYDQGG